MSDIKRYQEIQALTKRGKWVTILVGQLPDDFIEDLFETIKFCITENKAGGFCYEGTVVDIRAFAAFKISPGL